MPANHASLLGQRTRLAIPRACGFRKGHLAYAFPCNVRSAPVFYENIFLKSNGNAEAILLLDRLFHGCQPVHSGGVGFTMVAKLTEVERMLSARQAAVNDFANRPGADGSSIVEAFLADRATFQAPQGAGAGGAGGSAGLAPDANLTTEMSHIFRATGLASFIAMAQDIMSADVETDEGKLDAIAAGFRGDNILGRRVLCEGARTVASKQPALSRLFELRRHVPTYISWALVSDSAGATPKRLQQYNILGPVDSSGQPSAAGQTFWEKLMKFELQTMDWISAPGGLLAWKSAMEGGMAPLGKIHPQDCYTIPSVVQDLGLMIHKVLVAMGAAKESTGAALTFQDWTKRYVEHLWAAKHLPEDARLGHIDECHNLFAMSLRVAGDRMAETLNCLRPDLHGSIPPFFPLNEPPLSVVIEWQSTREQALNLMYAHRGIFSPVKPPSHAAGSSSEDPWELPRRSKRQRASEDPWPKKQKTGEGLSSSPPTDRARAEPGSLVASHLWLVKDTELYVSGKVWFVKKIAAHLKVKAGNYCWPVLLNARFGVNRLAHCESHRAKGHESLTSAAHVINGLNIDDLLTHQDKLWRYPDASERAKLVQRMEKAGLDASATARPARGRSRSRGGRGRRQGFR